MISFKLITIKPNRNEKVGKFENHLKLYILLFLMNLIAIYW